MYLQKKVKIACFVHQYLLLFIYNNLVERKLLNKQKIYSQRNPSTNIGLPLKLQHSSHFQHLFNCEQTKSYIHE